MQHWLNSRLIKPALFFMGLMLALLAGSQLAVAGAQQATQTTDSGGDPSYEAIAKILEDDESRQRLIGKLREMSSDDASAEAGDEQSEDVSDKAAESTSGFASGIADKSATMAQDIVSTITASLTALTEIGSGNADTDWSALTKQMLHLLVVIVATIFAYLLLRTIARRVFIKADNWAEYSGQPSLKHTLAISASVIVDLIVVALAWVVGYGVALFAIGSNGEMQVAQSLFLNAFLMIEIFKVVLRTVFSVRNQSLRLLPMADDTAAYWHGWLNRLANFIGYGVLVLVPVVAELLSQPLSQFLNVLIVLIAYFYAVGVIWSRRLDVRDRMQKQALQSDFSVTRVGVGMLARSWHLLGLVYFTIMAVALILNADDALPALLMATLQTLISIGVGLGLLTLLSACMGQPLRVSSSLSQRFPTLENRLNGFVPKIFSVLRIVILISVIAFVLDAWHLFNLVDWLGSSAGVGFIAKTLTVASILIVSMLIWIGMASWIEHRLNPEAAGHEPSAREKTLLTIFRNALAITLIIMTLMIVLSEIGINIGPLIAGAGVLGLAIGFGAQKLVQDVITGVFIQMENAINVGDIVTASGISGTAEKLTIRTLGLRDLSGTYHMIPFSSVDTVANYMREFAYHVGEYGVAYREDTDQVIVKLREAFDELLADDDNRSKILADELEVHGVTALADSAVNIRVRIKTLPGNQWAIGREYNRLVKRHLDAAGIEIPFPHLTLYFGEDKEGSAPAAPLRILSQGKETSGQDEDKALEDDSRSQTNPKHKGDFDED